MQFNDREDAAQRLATALAAYRGQHPLVLAIPRGAVPIAKIIAETLDGEVDVVLVHKLRAPYNPELAVGAIDESGWFSQAYYAESVGATAEYIEQEKAIQLRLLRQRRQLYTPERAPISSQDRIVIIVDDGLATGHTMLAALHSIALQKPARLICAVPVSPPETLAQVKGQADEVVCLVVPHYFQAISQFYRNFEQIDDNDVVSLLSKN